MSTVKIDKKELHPISPYLYMQFMEPLGVADSSVDAAWDFLENDWYPAVVDEIKRLSPTMIRFGGCFASYYHWKEAVGPQKARVPMINHCWGGKYFNQVGTHEFLDLCARVGAEPLLVANMESEGLRVWQYPKNDTVRLGTAEEVLIDIGDTQIKDATAYYIAAAPDTEITPVNIGCFEEKTANIENGRFTLPPAAVAAIEISI